MAGAYERRYVDAGGVRTQYLEAGDPSDETVVLVHSGEFGASAELSWERTIPALAEEFHVVAPDMLGYGGTDKLFDFEDAFDRRIRHVASFLDVLCIDEAHFVGNSMGGGYLLSLACEEPPLDWPVEKMILISGGAGMPEEVGETLKNYDGTEENMAEILELLFYDHERLGEEYLRRKTEASRIPGHWQTLAAIRLDPPFEQERSFRRRHDYENVHVPTLVVGGADDPLRPPEQMRDIADRVPTSELVLFEECHHCAHIERPDRFNELAIEYLSE